MITRKNQILSAMLPLLGKFFHGVTEFVSQSVQVNKKRIQFALAIDGSQMVAMSPKGGFHNLQGGAVADIETHPK
jgi:hypothetical protein